MHRALRGVITITMFLLMLVDWIIAWSVIQIVRLLMYPFSTLEQRQDVCGHIFRRSNYFTMEVLNPLWGSTVLNEKPKMPKGAKYMIMMNHMSNCDPWMAIKPILPTDCKWVAKGSLFKLPFGGWALEHSGDLAVKFTKAKGGWGTEKGSVGQLMGDAAKLLRRGQPIAIFPEGVRSSKPDGPLQEFKQGFFDLAVQEDAQIICLAISGTEKLWPVHDWQFDQGHAYFSFSEPISPKGHTGETLKNLVFDKLTAMRDAHPDRKLQKTLASTKKE